MLRLDPIVLARIRRRQRREVLVAFLPLLARLVASALAAAVLALWSLLGR